MVSKQARTRAGRGWWRADKKARVKIPDGPWASVDPGTKSTGVVIWDHKKFSMSALRTVPSGLVWEERSELIVLWFGKLCRFHRLRAVVIELPEVFDGALQSAIAQRGDIVKLAYLAGALGGAAGSQAAVYPIPVRMWKGQLPKKVVEANVRKLLPDVQLEKDEIDAAGLGCWAMGRL